MNVGKNIMHSQEKITNKKLNDLHDTLKNEPTQLYTYALNYNFLRALASVYYTSDEGFIENGLPGCLEFGIISSCASMDPIWEENKILIKGIGHPIPSCLECVNPYKALSYDKEESSLKTYWNYDFKQVILPPNWKLKPGCECDCNFQLGCFTLIDNHGEILKTLNFFDKKFNLC